MSIGNSHYSFINPIGIKSSIRRVISYNTLHCNIECRYICLHTDCISSIVQMPSGLRSRRMSDSDLSEMIYCGGGGDLEKSWLNTTPPIRKCLSVADAVGSLKCTNNAIDLDATDIEHGKTATPYTTTCVECVVFGQYSIRRM